MTGGDKTACRTPAIGRDGVTNIPTWKFDCIRRAILDELNYADCRWSDLTDHSRARLTADELSDMGKLGWNVVTVKLELEVRREIRRTSDKSPQILTLG